MDAEMILVTETEAMKTKYPQCDFLSVNLLDRAPHRPARTRYAKLCNACENEVEEKKNYNWGKSRGALKAHWNSRHKADFQFCETKNCTLPLTPNGQIHTCIYKRS